LSTYVLVAPDFIMTGGMDVANYHLADHLARQGHDLHLVSFRIADQLARYPNVRSHLAAKPANAYSLGGPFLAALSFAVIQRAHRPRVIVNGGNFPSRQTNWVHYVHAAYRGATAVDGWRRAKQSIDQRVSVITERVALRAARTVVVNSERTRRDVIDNVGVPAARVKTVYYGIDPERFYPPKPEERLEARRVLGWDTARPRIAFIGALGDRRKGFDVVFEAHRRLCLEDSWDAQVVVVGRGAELAQWQARARDLGIAERIEFLGFRSDVNLILRACDALVAPTRYEAYGLGVHEALCSGLPAFVSAGSGVAERYPVSLTELLLPDPNDAADLAARLRAWRERAGALDEEMLRFSTELRSRTWDHMASDIHAFVDPS
jgi:glycosyltransferase involved in cell wall biosynthesis